MRLSETAPACSLEIRELRLAVRLGCTAAERAVPQEVRASLVLRFDSPPRVCLTDRLEDTVCYAEIAEILTKKVRDREYQLVEKLGYELHSELLRRWPELGWAEIAMHKVRPPVPELQGGVVFRYGAGRET